MKALALMLALAACSPAYYVASGRRCPPTTMLTSDLVLVGAVLVVSGLALSNGSYVRGTIEGAGALGLWGLNSYTETACKR